MRALLDEWKSTSVRRQARPGDRAGALAAVQPRPQHLRQGPSGRTSPSSSGTQAEAKAAKEALVQEAEALVHEHGLGPHRRRVQAPDGPLARAGRASRVRRRRAVGSGSGPPRTRSSPPRTRSPRPRTRSSAANLAVKEELLTEAERILPVTDLDDGEGRAARHPGASGTRPARSRAATWSAWRRRLRRVEQAVRDADEHALDADQPRGGGPRPEHGRPARDGGRQPARGRLAKAEASGDAKKVADAPRPSSRRRSSGSSRRRASPRRVQRLTPAQALAGRPAFVPVIAVDVEDAVDPAHGLQHVVQVPGVAHLEGEPRRSRPGRGRSAPTPTGC